jgi:cyclopropane fatty-acyl-phospholipid synthase-like methyltransferase
VQDANIVIGDFREVRGEYDKVASIGCLEHAGRDQLAQVIQAHARVLKPGGLGLIHFIGHVGRHETDYFIRKYVFPGGWIPSLADTIVEMERAGLEVLDVENLRRHYALTLDAWAERFDPRAEQVRRALPPHLARVPVRLRGDVPRRGRHHPPLPDRVLQGHHHALPDDAGFPLRKISATIRKEKR